MKIDLANYLPIISNYLSYFSYLLPLCWDNLCNSLIIIKNKKVHL